MAGWDRMLTLTDVLLLDPALATGNSSIMAVSVLKARGVPEERIIFINLLASPFGIQRFTDTFPKLTIITAFVDEGMDERNFIVPGLGDFGDRYYCL